MPEAGKPCRLMAENDPSSLYRAFIFVKTTPQHVAAPSPPVNHRIPIARNRFENIRKILAV
jgi:hypothetical protein